MSRVRIALGLLAIVALALIGSGCGDDDESGDSGGESLTKAEYVKEGNAICSAGTAEIAAAAQERGLGPSSTEAEVAAFATEVLIPSATDQVEQLRELTPPEGDEETVQEFLDASDEGIATLEEDPAAFGSGPDPFAEANKLLNDYGLTVCGAG